MPRSGVTNPRLASRTQLFPQFRAALTSLQEAPQNNMHKNKWLAKFRHCRDGA